MLLRLRALSLGSLLAAVLSLPAVATAEPYVAAYAGVSFIENIDLATDLQINGGDLVNGRLRDISFEDGFLFGGKVGYFFDASILGGNLGIEVEGYHFENAIRPQSARFVGTLGGFPSDTSLRLQRADLEVTGAAMNFLYRFPLLTSPELPRGRVQPYVGVGVAVLIANLETRTTPLDVNPKIDDTDVQPAFQALAGIRTFLTRNLSLFFEYKAVVSQPLDFKFKVSGTTSGVPVVETARDRASITTHQLGAGIGFHW